MHSKPVDTCISFIWGVCGGGGILLNMHVIYSLGAGMASAFCCGIAGIAGKYFFEFVRIRYLKKNHKTPKL